MNYEVGKVCKARNEMFVKITEVINQNVLYPLRGHFIDGNLKDLEISWMEDGRYDKEGITGHDLVEVMSKEQYPELYL